MVTALKEVVVNVEEVTNNIYEHRKKNVTIFAYNNVKITVNDYECVIWKQNPCMNHAVIDYYMNILNTKVIEQRLRRETKKFSTSIQYFTHH